MAIHAIVVDAFGPPEGLRMAEMPVPVPGPGEVVVSVRAAPVNYVDLLVVGGSYQFLPARPFVPGKGPAGVIGALGSGVATLKIGDRVLAMAEQGGYAEAVAVAADQCYRLPSSMSFDDAASLSLARPEEHTSELQSRQYLVCRLLLDNMMPLMKNAGVPSTPAA